MIPKWKTKDGTLVSISEMTDSHLNNTINYLRKRGVSVNCNPTMYLDYIESDFDCIIHEYWEPCSPLIKEQYLAMLEEQHNRAITNIATKELKL